MKNAIRLRVDVDRWENLANALCDAQTYGICAAEDMTGDCHWNTPDSAYQFAVKAAHHADDALRIFQLLRQD